MSLYINLSSTRISWLLLYKIQMFIQRKRWYPIILDIDCGPYTFTCGRDAKHFYSDLVYVLSVIFIMILDHESVWTGHVYLCNGHRGIPIRISFLYSPIWSLKTSRNSSRECLSVISQKPTRAQYGMPQGTLQRISELSFTKNRSFIRKITRAKYWKYNNTE